MKIDAAPKTEILERNFTSTTTKTLGVSEEVLGHITQVLAGFYTESWLTLRTLMTRILMRGRLHQSQSLPM